MQIFWLKNNALVILNLRLTSSIPAKSSIVNISNTASHVDSVENDFTATKNNSKIAQNKNNHEPKTDEEILNYVIENSFKNNSPYHGARQHIHGGHYSENNKVIRDKKTPSPKLDQEDLDILNSIVPEPSIVILPEPSPKSEKLILFFCFEPL